VSFDSVWNHVVRHWEEIMWAAFFALVFALILDIVSPDSRTRAAIRYLRNRWSEHSTYLLARRILELEKYQKQLADTRWFYLFAFQSIFLSLTALSCAGLCWIFSILTVTGKYPQIAFNLTFASTCCFGVSAGFAMGGLRHVSRDTREKVEALVCKIGVEIEDLQKKLSSRSTRR
jgi:hypothetical protein